MTNPGDAVPYGADNLIRRIQDLERFVREGFAARSLESSVIGSNSLATVVQFKVASFTESGFAVTTTLTDHAVTTVDVPADFTQALVQVTAVAGLSNAGAVGSWAVLRVESKIQGIIGGNAIQGINGGQSATASCANALALTGLAPGSTISLATLVSFADVSSNAYATTTGSVIFAP